MLAVLLLTSIGLQLVNPQIMRSFLDTAQSGGAPQGLVRDALLFIGIALVQQIVSLGAVYLSENLAGGRPMRSAPTWPIIALGSTCLFTTLTRRAR